MANIATTVAAFLFVLVCCCGAALFVTPSCYVTLRDRITDFGARCAIGTMAAVVVAILLDLPYWS